MFALFCLAISMLIELAQPYLLEKLIDFIEAPIQDIHYPPSYGWTVASMMFLMAISSPLIKEHWFHREMVTCVQVKSGLIGAIYTKALKLSSSARLKYTQGQIQTLQSVDSDIIGQFPRHLFNILRGIISIYFPLVYKCKCF
jgi:hypothetical protein